MDFLLAGLRVPNLTFFQYALCLLIPLMGVVNLVNRINRRDYQFHHSASPTVFLN
jgi:hypothetical protein